MKRLKGIGVSPGFVRGTVYVLHSEDNFTVPLRKMTKDDAFAEITRFEEALTKTRIKILEIRKKLSAQIGQENSDIFNAHLLILEDRTLIEDVIEIIKKEQVNAEYAFSQVIRRYFKAFREIDDEYLRERIADIKDVAKRILQNLYGQERGGLENISGNVIVVAHDLSPSDTAMMDKNKILAFVTEVGGPTSHTAILGRSMEIPAVVGIDQATTHVKTGDEVIVDGAHGYLIVNPDEESIIEYTREEARFSQLILELDKLKDLPAETLDGRRIDLACNIEFHDEIPSVLSHGADGIGLYRTEYFYMNRIDLPTEEEQFRAYKQVAERMDPKPVIVRTLDLGGDKFISALDVPNEMNPFLGWRAIRFCLTKVDIFKAQLRAILRASAYGNLKIMYPMISNVQELRKANEILHECRKELKNEEIDFDENLSVGAMIEIPSAALISDILAPEVDFFSLGTNDLIQYSLAVDRVNEKIAYLYEPTHPAILRLIRTTIKNGHDQKKWVGICGEMSSDPALAVVLIGLEIDEISTSPVALPKVKKVIRSIEFSYAKKIAEKALTFDTGDAVRQYVISELREKLGDWIDN
jgi:phosphotransferase system enzyme I (PtsI)